MPSCLPNDLTEAAKGYQGISPAMLEAVKVYLLAQIAGLGSSTPDELAALAKCYACISPTMLKGMEVALLCTATGGVPVCPPCPPPSPGGNRGGDTFGLFSYGDSGATGAIVITDEHCIPGYDIESEPGITSLSWPNLINVDPTKIQNGALQVKHCPVVASISAPLLTTMGYGFDIEDNADLSSVSLPSTVNIGSQLSCFNNPSLTTMDLSSWVPANGVNYQLFGNAFNASTVQLILRRLVLAGVTTCAIDVSGGTSAGTASLNAQGQADVATLGEQLTINP